METQITESSQDKPTGYFLWFRLKAALAWLKRVVMATLIAGSFYIGAATPVRAAGFTANDYGTLVTAINNANDEGNYPGLDTITLTGDITLSGNLPLIRSDIVFEGNSHSISGNDQYRVFFVGRFDSAPTVTFRNLTIQHGRAQGGNGGGGGAGLGGGIFVYDGNVTVQNVTFANNAALGGSRTGSLGGGGMGGNGGSSNGGGGGLWAGADGGSGANNGGGAGNYGGGGGGASYAGGAGGGLNGGGGGYYSGGGGGLNGGGGGYYSGGGGGWGGGGGGGRWYGGNGGLGGGGGGGGLNGGSGGFGGGGGTSNGAGGFGGGGASSGAGGFGGSADGGGAGLGGGLFIRTGVLTMTAVAFNDNAATGGATNGQGKGGGLFVLHSTTNTNGNHQGMPATLPSIAADSCGVTFSDNAAANDAGTPTDNDDVFGNLGSATSSCGVVIAKSVTPDTDVPYHGLVTYTVALRNIGLASDTNVILTDTLPAGVDFSSWVISPTSTLRAGNDITWTGTVTTGETLTWTLIARHTGNYGDVITNTAYFSGTTQVGSGSAAFGVEQPVIGVAKSVTPASNVPYHGLVTYTIALRNTGSVSDTNVTLTDTLPAQVDFGSWIENHGATVVGDEITWSGVVTASAGITFTFSATHTGDYRDVVTNTAYFSGILQSGSASAVFSLPRPVVGVAKSVTPTSNVPYHGGVTYTVVLSNTGALSDTNVILTDTLPAQVDFGSWIENHGATVTDDEITWNGVVTALESITFTFTAAHTGDYGDVVTNTADFSGILQSGSSTAVFAIEPAADLVLAKSVAPDPTSVGDALTYTLHITNTGPHALPAGDGVITVADELPADVTFNGAGGAGWTCNNAGQLVMCTTDALALGAAPDIVITANAPTMTGLITNTAYVTSTYADPNPGNNSAWATVLVGEPDIVVQAPPLAAEVCLDQTANIDIQICNSGTGPLHWTNTERASAVLKTNFVTLNKGVEWVPAGVPRVDQPIAPGSDTADYADRADGRSINAIEALGGSNVTFDPSAGGNACYLPGVAQTFCFKAESFTNDNEFRSSVWERLPANWTVTDVYTTGTPVCDSGAPWGSFDWGWQTAPYEVWIDHRAYQNASDHCVATYCFDVTPGAGVADALVSWYWAGDEHGDEPHYPCSYDYYTPDGQPSCDEAIKPLASIPPCYAELPWLSASPTNGTVGAGDCQTVTVSLSGLTPGSYTGDLEINSTDSDTPQVTLPVTLTVNDPPQAGFDWSPLFPLLNQGVTFNGWPRGTAPISYTWDFGDGSTGAGPTATHSYGALGDYTVYLTKTNVCGYDAISHTVSVVPSRTLAVNLVGQGAVQMDPPGGVYGMGTPVNLTAVPAAGWRFDQWAGDASGSANPAQVLMDGNKVVTATFLPGVTGIGQWVVVVDATVSEFGLINAANDQPYGPFLRDQLGSEGGQRFDVAVTPDGSTALISNFGDSEVFLVDLTNPLAPSLRASVRLPFFAEDIDITADGQYALVADGGFSPRLATIHIPSARLVANNDLGMAYANGVAIAPDGTVVFPDYFAGSIHSALLDETGAITYSKGMTQSHTYTYTYPGYDVTDPDGWPRHVNVGIAPDGQTVIVCDAVSSTVGVYRIVEPGVLTFTGVVTGLDGILPFEGKGGNGQSVAFSGDKAYLVINGVEASSYPYINYGDRLGVLNITGPGQVSLEAGGVATLPHHTSSQLFGVDVAAVANNKVYVGYPTLSNGDYSWPLAVVDLADDSVSPIKIFSPKVDPLDPLADPTPAIPAGVAVLPLRLYASLEVSDPEPAPGQIIAYTLTLTNGMASQISQLTLRDVLPPEVEFVGPVTLFPTGAGIVGAPPELVANLVIPGRQHVTMVFHARVRAAAPGTVVYNGIEAASPELFTSAWAVQMLTVAPHLALHKAVSDPTPNPHQIITYTLTLTNTGVADDPAVVLTDILPAQVAFGAWVARPSGATINDNTIAWTGSLDGGAVLTLSFTATQLGSYNEVVTNTAEVSGMGQTGSATITYTVAPNVAPVLDVIGAQTVDELVTLVLTPTASDVNGYPPLTFTLDAGSVGSITPDGVFTWTPTEADGPGVYTAAVRVSDGALADSEMVSITVAEVNLAPVLGALPDRFVQLGDSVSLTATATDADIPMQTLTFTLDAGSVGSLTPGGAFSWTPSALGVYTAAVRVSDGALSAAEALSITVVPEPVYTLHIAQAGDGQGVVTPGIGDYTYISGTTAILTATAQPGSVFDGWSGAASGSEAQAQIVMDADQSVTATFSLISATCTPVTAVDLTLVSATPFYPGDVITFSATLTPPALTTPYSYTLDGGATLTGSANPLIFTRSYAAEGTHTVALAVWNCPAMTPVTDTLPIVVQPALTRVYLPLVLRSTTP